MVKGKMIAMILAGGQGSRLKALTRKNAKPAVYFGGKYRIIDFALSNCANSGIHQVGILTQYQPLGINTHIGIGVPWDLDRRDGGVEILPPYMSSEGGRWYDGTANAIYENMDYVDIRDPEFVLILSGDHIYKMDYAKMLQTHIDKGADITLSVIEVPWEETHRFGILNTLPDDTIYEFEEKPKRAKSNLASMGIYIFNWKLLKKLLVEDQKKEDSTHDFGKDIIPAALELEKYLLAYRFEGYWKDVGTLESYWEANMDLIDPDNTLDLFDEWKIFTRNLDVAPHYIATTGDVENVLVNEGCIVKGVVKNSILSTGVIVEEGARVTDSVILPGAKIGERAVVKKAIVMSGAEVKPNETVGDDSGEITLISSRDLGMI
ncbi:MAG: glucose-1-phosphate adenylyltransferase [Tissierellia bacterium]|jgi:glucose-1-phosphate adenylyltransferase|nr:glucose-1-phosphate adenylyltransferase [Tissierellia bacterium]